MDRPGRGLVADAAGWSFPEAAGDAALVAGHHAFAFEAMDAWYEEDDPVLGHPPDPYHRIDVRHSGREVRVLVDGVPVARSTAARLLFETGLPTRYYLPRADVDPAVLLPSDTHTRCAYKGVASYLSVRAGGRVHRDLVWFYPEPAPEGRPVHDLLCFFTERPAVQVEVDGKPVRRPSSMWKDERIPPAPMPR
ncbi:DUF427 domain-containing protein [Pseudonocardia sp. H11422]|uniref:DUF427 domain-containing protein n=1 Tax=Pseudonocardia sp. H11422 TaxID=2835866 RepID=UPI0027E29A8C|nr:DUF427 domain-containing protein [Pseudonocardia sp. H11422]